MDASIDRNPAKLIFSHLPLAFFSPSVDVRIIQQFEIQGGSYVPPQEIPIPIKTDTATNANHPLFRVSYYFVSGAADPFCSILRNRILVLFDASWVEASVKKGQMVGLEGYIIDPDMALNPMGTSRPVAWRGHGSKLPGDDVHLDVDVDSDLELDQPSDLGDMYLSRSSRPSHSGKQRPVHPNLDMEGIHETLGSMERPRSRAKSLVAEQSQTHSRSSVTPTSHNILSKYPTIYVDQKDFSSQGALLKVALERFVASRNTGTRHPRPGKRGMVLDEDPQSEAGPSRSHSDPHTRGSSRSRPLMGGEILSELSINTAVLAAPSTPTTEIKSSFPASRDRVTRDIDFSSPKGECTSMSRSAPTPPPWSTIFDPNLKSISDLDPAKVELFKSKLMGKKYSLEDVYTSLYMYETEDYKIQGLEPARLVARKRKREGGKGGDDSVAIEEDNGVTVSLVDSMLSIADRAGEEYEVERAIWEVRKGVPRSMLEDSVVQESRPRCSNIDIWKFQIIIVMLLTKQRSRIYVYGIA